MKIACAALFVGLAACHRHEQAGSGPHTVERDYARPAGLVWSAAVASVKDEGLVVQDANYESHGGAIVGEALRVSVTPIREARCRVSIRVGPDDLGLARRLHERIAGNLQAKPGGRP
jgi:hypothetical protein